MILVLLYCTSCALHCTHVITLLVGEKLCRKNVLLFDYLELADKDSDYTVVIDIMQ